MNRIISGEARGRKIKVPPEGTRPTSDRAREGLFSSLQVRFGFVDMNVLDLFAGSGALGLEALSRKAASVHFVELGGQGPGRSVRGAFPIATGAVHSAVCSAVGGTKPSSWMMARL